MDISKEIDDFCLFVLQNPNKPIQNLFNSFIKAKDNEEIEENFILFVKSAEKCRESNYKKIIQKKLENMAK